jgi:predicted DNA-binding transcriptional regulator AlpA
MHHSKSTMPFFGAFVMEISYGTFGDGAAATAFALLKPKDATRLCKIGTTTLYKWCREGKLTPIKFGPRCTRFRLSEVQALIDAHAASGEKGVV